MSLRVHILLKTVSAVVITLGCFLQASAAFAVAGCPCTTEALKGATFCVTGVKDATEPRGPAPPSCRFMSSSSEIVELVERSPSAFRGFSCDLGLPLDLAQPGVEAQHCPLGTTDVSGLMSFLQKDAPVLATKEPLVKPELGIKIPGLEFGEAVRQGQFLIIPFLAQYISAVYKYLVGIIGVIAIMMIMYGGFRYLIGSAAGDVKKGKQIVVDAVVGMFLLFSAVLILRTVNPMTLNLDSIRVRLEPIEADEVAEDEIRGPPERLGEIEACAKLANYITSGAVGVRHERNDLIGLREGKGKVKRGDCKWCYKESPDDAGACVGDPQDGQVEINPMICQMLVDIVEQKNKESARKNSSPVSDDGFENYGIRQIYVTSLVGNHSRCARPLGNSCEKCKNAVRAGKGVGNGQSNHWTGDGIDLAPDAGVQRYLVNKWLATAAAGGAQGSPTIGFKQLIGPLELRGEYSCDKGARRGKAYSPFLCQGGVCGATYSAEVVCGHLDHIHVGF